MPRSPARCCRRWRRGRFASARRSRSGRSGCRARSSASTASASSPRSTRTPPGSNRAIRCAAPGSRCRCRSDPAWRARSTMACCAGSTPTRPSKRRSASPSCRVRQSATRVAPGQTLGEVEGAAPANRCLVPPGVEGRLVRIAARGELGRDAEIAVVRDDAGREHCAAAVPALAGAPAAAGGRAAAGRRAAGHRAAHPRHAVPGRARRPRGDPRRLRHRQDGAAGDAGQVVPRRRDRLRRLRRARQRDGRGAARIPAARRPAHRPHADGAHGDHRQRVEHAGRGARGQHLHRGHRGRVLPRPGPARRADGRLDEPLGRGAARGLGPAGRTARRSRLPGLPELAPGRVLRARRARDHAVGRRSAR